MTAARARSTRVPMLLVLDGATLFGYWHDKSGRLVHWFVDMEGQANDCGLSLFSTFARVRRHFRRASPTICIWRCAI